MICHNDQDLKFEVGKNELLLRLLESVQFEMAFEYLLP